MCVLRNQLSEWRGFSFDVVYFCSQVVDLLDVVLTLHKSSVIFYQLVNLSGVFLNQGSSICPQFVDQLGVVLNQLCVSRGLVTDNNVAFEG